MLADLVSSVFDVSDWAGVPERELPNSPTIRRRALLAGGVAGFVGSAAGCSWNTSVPEADVVAGPNGRLAFEPTELTVSVGESVTWGFPTSGHNVCCRPTDTDEVSLPTGGEAFASYGPDESPQGAVVPLGRTYEHTFDSAGEYVYVCVPHVNQGMVGTVRVE